MRSLVFCFVLVCYVSAVLPRAEPDNKKLNPAESVKPPAAVKTISVTIPATTENLIQVAVPVNAQRCLTRMNTLVDRGLPAARQAAVKQALFGANFHRDINTNVHTAFADIDTEGDDVQTKRVDRQFWIELARTQAVLFTEMRTERLTFHGVCNFAKIVDAKHRAFVTLIAPSIFLHVTKNEYVAAIKEGGLNPSLGGNVNGIAANGGVVGVQQMNAEAAVGKSFVTRSSAEVGQYMGAGKQKLLVYICEICGDSQYLSLDPDSQHGLYYEKKGFQAGVGKAIAAADGPNDKFAEYCHNRVKTGPLVGFTENEFVLGKAAYLAALYTFFGNWE